MPLGPCSHLDLVAPRARSRQRLDEQRCRWLIWPVRDALASPCRLGRDCPICRTAGDIGRVRVCRIISPRVGWCCSSVLQRHADYGADILAESTTLVSIAPAMRAHHERIDGAGYPLGLVGSQIPFHARIVAVCDAYDAMSNTRQYRNGMSLASAIEVLEQQAGSQWHPRVVDTVVRSVRANPPTEVPQLLDSVGRIGCDCIPGGVHVEAA